MKYSPYSITKFECYDQCRRKFKYRYIDKIKPPIDMYAIERGRLWHDIIEKKINGDICNFIKPQFECLTDEQYRQELQNIINFVKTDTFVKYYYSKLDKLTEQKFYIDIDGDPYLAKPYEYVFTGTADLLLFNDEILQVVDWKTGGKSIEKLKRFPKNTFQLDIYSYAFANLFNIFENVVSKFCFVEFGYEQKVVGITPNIWKYTYRKIEEIEENKNFDKNITKLCDYCEFRNLCDNDL